MWSLLERQLQQNSRNNSPFTKGILKTEILKKVTFGKKHLLWQAKCICQYDTLCSLLLIHSSSPTPNFYSPSYSLIISRSFPMLYRKPLISENDKLQNWVIKLHYPSSQVLSSIVFSLITFFRSCQTVTILISSSHTGYKSCGLWKRHSQQHYPL